MVVSKNPQGTGRTMTSPILRFLGEIQLRRRADYDNTLTFAFGVVLGTVGIWCDLRRSWRSRRTRIEINNYLLNRQKHLCAIHQARLSIVAK